MKAGEIELKSMKAGDCFGEAALLAKDAKRTKTVCAKADHVVLLALSRTDVFNILGEKVQLLAFKNVIRWAIQKNVLLSKLINVQREKLIEKMTIRKLTVGNHPLISGGHPQFGVVLEGSV